LVIKSIVKIGIALGIIISISNCELREASWAKENAERQCGTCHLTPTPSSLTTKIWEQSILPEMSTYFQWQSVSKYEYAKTHFNKKKGSLPMNDKTWSSIVSYYSDNSPTTIDTIQNVLPLQNIFEEVTLSNICELPTVTAIEFDADKQQLLCASSNRLSSISKSYEINTVLNSEMTITDIKLRGSEEIYYLDVGTLAPNDLPTGSLNYFDREKNANKVLKTGLRRPVHILSLTDKILISEHGNNIGKYSEYDIESGDLIDQIPLPGIYKTFEADIDNDGKSEIILQIGQGKEGIYVWSEDRQLEGLVISPPEYGTSDLDIADVNGDGYLDLLVTNGDNADYSGIPKPYHGLRIYLNDGTGSFEEKYFYQMYGATQVRCIDANADGKKDILVSSFFPMQVDQSIVYLQQNDEEMDFDAFTFDHAIDGRWLVMDVGDVDGDGDEDVFLGSFVNGPTKLPGQHLDRLIKESVDILVLVNTTYQ